MYHKDVFVESVSSEDTDVFFFFADIAVNQVSENTFCGFEKCHRGQKLLYKKLEIIYSKIVILEGKLKMTGTSHFVAHPPSGMLRFCKNSELNEKKNGKIIGMPCFFKRQQFRFC